MMVFKQFEQFPIDLLQRPPEQRYAVAGHPESFHLPVQILTASVQDTGWAVKEIPQTFDRP
jgi:hypothetical protein